MALTKTSTRNPWAWVTTLYFAQGIPYVVVMTVSVIMYKRLGISNTDIALYTSWLYLPWVIKPLWSPLIELFRTKRFWIISLQLVIGAALAAVALTIPAPSFFQYTLSVFWLMAFSSATHDIAADGFYMLGLEQHQQAAFSGVRSTFYRVAMITGQGLLVVLAGTIESRSSLPIVDVNVEVSAQAPAAAWPAPESFVFREEPDLRVISAPDRIVIPAGGGDRLTLDSLLAASKAWNQSHGFTVAEQAAGKKEPDWFQRAVATPIAGFIRDHFAEATPGAGAIKGNIGVFYLHLSRAPEEESGRVVTVERTDGDKSVKVVEGERLQFTMRNWSYPAAVVVQLDPTLRTAASAVFTAKSGNLRLAWSVTFIVLTALFLVFFVYHKFILPYPPADTPSGDARARGFLKEFFHIFMKFFTKKQILATIAFLLLYRFAEAQLVKLVTPFLLDIRDKGGMGLTTSEVGVVYGTVGIIALTLGGLLGGYLVSRHGLRFWLWPMVLIIHLPDLMFIYLSYVQPESFVLINAAVAIEQFGYGFGFTAYMLYMIYVAEGEHKTAHYAICTGIMALGMMLPGMFSGWLQEIIGYRHFFVWIILSTIPGFFVATLVKIPREFGKKASV